MSSPTRPNSRIDQAARDLEESNRELVEFLSGVGPEQLRSARTAEGWPLVGAAYHVADGYRIHMRWLDLLRKAEPIRGSPADLDEEDARAVADAEDLTSEVVMSAIQIGGRLLVAYLRNLDDAELGSAARHGPLQKEISVDLMLDIACQHVHEHLRIMRASVSAPWS